jgi:hypothetical protein
MGRGPELTGGGLIRSMGGWTSVKALRSAKAYMKGDERILGDGDFLRRKAGRPLVNQRPISISENRGDSGGTFVQNVGSGRQGHSPVGEASTELSRSQVQPCQLLVSDT